MNKLWELSFHDDPDGNFTNFCHANTANEAKQKFIAHNKHKLAGLTPGHFDADKWEDIVWAEDITSRLIN